MKILFRILIGVLLLLLLVCVAAVSYISFADLSRHKPHIEQLVSKMTGRTFTIGGDFELDVLPTPSLLAEDVSLTNAAWGSEPLMAEIGHFSTEIDMKSLLFGPAVVRRFKLDDVDVLIEKNQDGGANTSFGAGGEPKPPAERDTGAAELPLLIDFAELNKLTVTLREPGKEDSVHRIDRLTVQPDEAGNLTLEGTGQLKQHPLELKGAVGPLEQLQALGRVEYEMSGRLGPLDLNIDGLTKQLKGLRGTQLNVAANTGNIADLLQLAGVESKLSAPLKLKASLDNTGKDLDIQADIALADVNATLQAGIDDDTVNFDGTIDSPARLGKLLEIQNIPEQKLSLQGAFERGRTGISLQDVKASMGKTTATINGDLSRGEDPTRLDIEIEGDSLAELDPGLPAIAFNGSTEAELGPGDIQLDPLKLQFGDSDLHGSVQITTGDMTVINANLRSKQIDMIPFTQESEESGESDSKPAPAPETETEAPTKKYVFSTEPLPFGTLKKTQADIKLFVNTIRFENRILESLDFKTRLHNRDLSIKANLFDSEGGKAAADINLNTAGEDATFDMLVQAKDLRLNLASGDVQDQREIPEIDLTLDIKSRGNSPRRLASAADGRLLLTQGSGQVENEILAKISGDLLAQLFEALNPLAKEEKYTRWDCSIFAMVVEDGLAEITGFLLQGEKIMVVGGGDIDFKTEKLNIEFNTKPRKGVGLSADMFVTPFVKLSGTLAEPGIGLNAKGAVLTTGAAVATMGVSVLVTGVAERASAEGDKCAKTLAELPPHAKIN